MAPGYLNFQTTFLIDLNEDHNHQPLIFPEDHNQCHQQQYFPLNSNNIIPHHLQASSSSTTSSSTYPINNCPIYLFNNPSSNNQAGYSFAGSQFQPYPIKQEVDDNYGSIGSSSYDQTASGTLEINKKDENNKNVLKFSISKKQDQSFPVDSTYHHHHHHHHHLHHQTLISHEDQNQISSGVGGDGDSLFADQWMSSKMRLMKKMMKEEAAAGNEAAKARNNNCIDSNNCNNVTATIRVCSDCNTTKTPLWRSGPRGPKTLCNACGIRQRKARRAMAAAAAANSNNISASNSQTHLHMSTIRTAAGVGSSNKKTSTGGGLFGAQKKRSKLNNKPLTPRTSSNSSATFSTTTDHDNGRKTSTNWFEEFASSLSEKLSLDQQVLFPEEEKDAAILLMAISCGLVNG